MSQTSKTREPFDRDASLGRVRPSRFDRFAAITVLALFAVTWPVLELLGNNAEFFFARNSSETEIVVLAVTLTLVIPPLVGAVGGLPGRVGESATVAALLILATTLALLYVRRLDIPWWVSLLVALIAGGLLTLLFYRSKGLRQAGRYLLGSPAVMILVFLFATPAGAVVLGRSSDVDGLVAVDAPAPVVMIVFDEFPVASIIDAEGRLRGARYPNLGRLASEGVWFPNAVTVAQQTEHSIPAMLTGSMPDRSLTPFAGQYPFNLFTELQGTHDLRVHEAITQLCPRSLCQGVAGTDTPILRDVSVVAGHVLLPEPLADHLPPIDTSWGDFEATSGGFDPTEEFRETLQSDPRRPVDRFIEEIRGFDGELPPLFYLHALIPHHPWQLLPDGSRYPIVFASNPAASDGGGWNADEFLVAQSAQRHLLQVGYADRVVGEVVAALEEAGIYQESLVFVVADHGISFTPGVEHRREITPSTVGEIAAIPLFVKPPGGTAGVVDGRRALTIDILPTVAHVLGADLTSAMAGFSLLGPAPERTETTTFGPEGAVTYGPQGEEKLEAASNLESLVPNGDPWAVRPAGSPDLMGERIDLSALDASSLRGRIADPSLYQNIDVYSGVVPVRVDGYLYGDLDGTEVVAVSVNGVVGAVTRSYSFEGESLFQAMIPPELLVDGPNTIGLVEVGEDGTLSRIRKVEGP